MRPAANFLLVLIIGCSATPGEPVEPTQDERTSIMPRVPGNPPNDRPVIPVPPIAGVNATVEFLQIEGGCWALKIGNELNQPLNLPAEFRQDGLAVRVVLQPAENVGSVCMIGPIVRIVSISRR